MSEYTWCDFSETWCDTDELWSQCEPIIKKLKRGRSSGELTKQFGKLRKDEKKILVKVILIYKGKEYIDEHEIEKYKVTIKDLKMIISEYDRREKMKVSISDIKVV